MARYKLLSQHFSEEDKLLEVDTIVGDGTEHAWTRRPTIEMEGLDEEGRRLVERERTRQRERGASDNRIAPIDDLPMTVGEADARYEADVRAGEREMAERERPVRRPLYEPDAPPHQAARRPGRSPAASQPKPPPDPEEEEEPEPDPEEEPPPQPAARASFPTMIDRSRR